MEAVETFQFMDSYGMHTVGDEHCEACWREPERCECGGWVHTSFGDENRNGDYWLYYLCDKCGSTDHP